MPIVPQTLFEELTATFPEYALTFDAAVPCFIVPAAGIKDICLQLRDHEQYLFDSLMCLSGSNTTGPARQTRPGRM